MPQGYNTRRFFTRNDEAWKNQLCSVERLADRVRVDEYEHAVVLPLRFADVSKYSKTFADGLFEGGVCDCDLKFVAGHERNRASKVTNLECVDSYVVDESEIAYREEEVIFGGILYRNIGHALLDSLSRLWYVVSSEDDRKIVFLESPANFERVDDFDPMDVISMLDIPDTRIEVVRVPTRFAKVVVPCETFITFTGYMPEFVIPLRKISETAATQSIAPQPIASRDCKKVYFTRTAFKSIDPNGIVDKHLINEEFFEEFYRKRGFQVVSPEKMKFSEQVALIAGAEEIVTTNGTLSHLAVFAKPSARITVLMRSEVLGPQFLLDKACGLTPYYVDAASNPLCASHYGGPFLMLPTRYFKEYLGAIGCHYDEKELDFSDRVPDFVMQYMREWAQVYRSSDSRAYELGRFTMYDLVKCVNDVFYESTFDEAAYRSADYYRDTIGVLEGKVKDLRSSLREQKALCKDLSKSLKAERKKTSALEKEVKSIKNSLSWKLTEPLRRLKRRFKS